MVTNVAQQICGSQWSGPTRWTGKHSKTGLTTGTTPAGMTMMDITKIVQTVSITLQSLDYLKQLLRNVHVSGYGHCHDNN